MIEVIKERTPVTTKEYHIEFSYKDDPTAGFCFPATSHGKPDFSSMTSEAQANYKACLTNPLLTEAEFTTTSYTYMEPAVGKCSCGSLVTLDADYMGAVRCECGRWYNLFGQSLIDPKYWYIDEDDYYSDMPEDL
jgi:hypothetical protein